MTPRPAPRQRPRKPRLTARRTADVPRNSYVVQQPFRGVATFLVRADSAAEALRKVNEGDDEDVEGLDKDVTWVGRAVYVRLEARGGPS